MRRLLVWAYLTGAIVSLGVSATSVAEDSLDDEMTNSKSAHVDVVTEILRIEHDVMDAIKTGDVGALSQILSADFVHRTPEQGDADREAFLSAIKSIPFEIIDISGEDLKVSVFGSVAVLSGVQRATVKDDEGNLVSSSNAFTDVFELIESEWKLVLAFSVELASP